MKIIINDYPVTLTFTTKKKLPAFKYGCSVRTRLLQDALQTHPDILLWPHEVRNYLVEAIESMPGCEIWHVGS